jgi:hypothetical protein
MPLTPLLTRKIEDLALMLKSGASSWPIARHFTLSRAGPAAKLGAIADLSNRGSA